MQGEKALHFFAANRCGWCHTVGMANLREAKAFVERWKDKGDEKQETQRFWIELLDKVLEDRDYDKHILFEVVADKTQGGSNFKDAVINRFTDHAVLIEQKSSSLRLDKSEPRFSRMVTPFEQAKHYDDLSAVGDKARWIITCNFREFWIYDMEKTGRDLYTPAAMITLEELPSKLHWLDTLITHPKEKIEFIDEVAVSTEAGRLVGVMYDALRKRYADPDSDETAKSLNKLCVRIVFCLYAEDAGLFNKNNRKIFHDYLAQYDAKGMRKALIALFRVLNQRIEERDKYLADDDPLLASFPYVNGGLFEGDVEIPPFDDEIREILLVKESMGFDWSVISPTIFGAVFESTLNDETRRSGGMHYTSIENIHRVIDPLFLDDLTAELDEILKGKQANVKNRKLIEFQKKIAGLKFLDPAAGSGNFLTESYLSLRRLENQCIKARLGYRVMSFGFDDEGQAVKVSIKQFYGIEINDFAVSVAKTALWIAEAQMYEKTQEILSGDKEFLPLHEYDNIREGNALRMDWNDVVPASELNYIMGNPPFVGNSRLTEDQKKDRDDIFSENGGELDYVACWYKKSADYIGNSPIKCAFVSTNSICQGQQVYPLWKLLFDSGIIINYAYKTFIWDSEASLKAHVYCIIVGFSRIDDGKCILFDGESRQEVKHINGYLLPQDNIFISKRKTPLCDSPIVIKGFQPTDNGYLILDDHEKDELCKKEPEAEKWIRPFITAREYLYRKNRWCLWLVNATPAEINRMPLVKERVKACKAWRESQIKTGDAFKLRNMPALMRQNSKFVESSFIVMPRVTGERRKYIPFGFVEKGSIPGDSIMLAIGADLYHFGIVCSIVHMAWTRVVCGRLKGDYRYSSDIVYNNFPWPVFNEKAYRKITDTANDILSIRSKYSGNSYDDLYDPDLMPYDLAKAHEKNDRAVMEAYGFRKAMTESEIVAELMQMYQKLAKM